MSVEDGQTKKRRDMNKYKTSMKPKKSSKRRSAEADVEVREDDGVEKQQEQEEIGDDHLKNDENKKAERKKRKAEKKRKALDASSKDQTTTTTAAASPQQPPQSAKKVRRASTPAAVAVRSSMSPSDTAKYRAEHSIAIDDDDDGAAFAPLAAFAETGLDADLLACTGTFTSPTPIQAQCWPILLSGRDCVGIAETGSGKTLAFALPGLAHVRTQADLGHSVASRGPVVLVLAPTRELAMQSAAVCAEAGRGCGQRTVCVYGGGDRRAQVRDLERGAHTVVATPGRLLGYMREGVLALGRVTYLVLDEADRMLDLGFEPDIRAIVAAITSPIRQTVMFSATWPTSIQQLASEFLHDPVRVTIGSDQLTANANVTQFVEVVDTFARDARLETLLRQFKDGPVIVFVLYKKEAVRVEAQIRRRGWACTSLHGDKSQVERTAALDEFRSGRVPILIATDVAARGLDVPEVQYVINYSFPLTIEDYVHRIGRTGRAGQRGTAHTFFTTADRGHSGELINILTEAGANVPEALLKFGAGVKKKQHALYGCHFRHDQKPMPAKTHVKF